MRFYYLDGHDGGKAFRAVLAVWKILLVVAIAGIAALFGLIYYLDNVVHDGHMHFPLEPRGVGLAQQPHFVWESGEKKIAWVLHRSCGGTDYQAVTSDYVEGGDYTAWWGGNFSEVTCDEVSNGLKRCVTPIGSKIQGYVEQGFDVWLVVTGVCNATPKASFVSQKLVIGQGDLDVELSYGYQEIETGFTSDDVDGLFGVKSIDAEKERLVEAGIGFWHQGHAALPSNEMQRVHKAKGDVPSGFSDSWSDHYIYDGDRYDVWLDSNYSSRLSQAWFHVYRNGTEYTRLLADVGASGAITQASVVSGEPAFTFRVPETGLMNVRWGSKGLLNEDFTTSGSYSPFEYDGHMGFVGVRNGQRFVVFDGKRASANFDEIRTVACCAIMPFPFEVYENGILFFMGRRDDRYYYVEINLARRNI